MALVQGIEGMEEFLLNPFLSREKLDVIDQKHVCLPISFPEFGQLVVLDAVDVLVGELLTGNVSHPSSPLMLGHKMADGMEQVRLAQSDAAIQEERVVGLAWLLRHSQGGGAGEIVIAANHEGIKGVVGIEARIVLGSPAIRDRLGNDRFGRRSRSDQNLLRNRHPGRHRDLEFDL